MTRQLIIGLVILAVLTIIVSLTTIVGFFIGDLQMVLASAKILSLTSLVLMSVFFKSVYEEMSVNTKEVRMELKSKEDVEEFRKQLDKQLQEYIKEIAEEEEIKDKKDE